MGGRGSRSATATRGRGVAVPAQQAPQQQPTQTATVPVQPANQPVLTLGATTDMATIQAMTPQQFAQYVEQQNKAANPMSAMLHDSATQRLIYDTGLNGKPQVVDDATFRQMPGMTLYRTVNSAYDAANDVYHPADQIARQTMQSGMSRIGGGVHGDGFYFDTSSTLGTYGNRSHDVTKTAMMSAKFNGGERIVTKDRLTAMLRREPKAVRDAMSVPHRQKDSYRSSNNNLGAYALYKGYNVIRVSSRGSGGYHVILDRSVLTFSSKLQG